MLETGMGFTAEVSKLMGILKHKEPAAATVLVTATMSKAVKRLVTEYLPDLQRIEAQGFHKAVATASHSFRWGGGGGRGEAVWGAGSSDTGGGGVRDGVG